MPLDPLHREIARRLREAIARKQWSLNECADHAGLGRGHVSEILRGRSSPTIRTLAKLADALDVEIADLIPRSE